jgi:signal transduction histidine kinase
MSVFDHIFQRIEEKKENYALYRFTQNEDRALKTFFDLAQELDSMKDLHRLCVAIPKKFFSLDARLFLINPRNDRFMLVTSSEDPSPKCDPPGVPAGDLEYSDRGSMVLNIRGKRVLLEELPFKSIGDTIGLLEVITPERFEEHQELFFVKYANRMGFNLHNRFLVEKNVEHLRFIRSLVADIEHNIIAPNIVYKLYIKNIKAATKKSMEAEEILKSLLGTLTGAEGEHFVTALQELSDSNLALRREAGEMDSHHRNMSLFIESLMRRSHFDQGRLTLKKKKCNMFQEVVRPQLERYADRFASLGIEVDYHSSGIPEEEVIGVVDVGLMAQVYANLFSNALKYTQEIDTLYGKKKYVAYGYEVLIDHLGPGRDALKYNVFSTGPHVTPEEREHIFDDQYRGSNIESSPGSGHGLYFIRNVVEIHGGTTGYEPTEFGNNFYFILPRVVPAETAD